MDYDQLESIQNNLQLEDTYTQTQAHAKSPKSSTTNDYTDFPLSPGFNITDTPDLRNLKYLVATDHLNCPICRQPFIKPMTTLCGHTFCDECIRECFKMATDSVDHVGLCPLDRTPIDASTNDLFPTPVLINNLVDDLKVYCLNQDRGCSWEGCRWEVEHHLVEDCGYTGVRCGGRRSKSRRKSGRHTRSSLGGDEGEGDNDNDNDNDSVVDDSVSDDIISDDSASDNNVSDDSVENIDSNTRECNLLVQRRFLNNQCVHQKYKCQYCSHDISKLTEETHLTKECSLNYQTCELCLNDMIPMKSLETHQSSCKSSKFICPAREIGCKFVGTTEPSLDNHLTNNCQLINFLPYHTKLSDKVTSLVSENKFLQRQINKILNSIVQGKITNLGYNEPIEEINKFKDFNDLDQDKLVYLNYELDRLRYQVDEKLVPFVNKQTSERDPIMNNLVNDNFMMRDDLNLQRMLINSLRKQIQFILFKNNRPAFNGLNMNAMNPFDEESDEERMGLNLKL